MSGGFFVALSDAATAFICPRGIPKLNFMQPASPAPRAVNQRVLLLVLNAAIAVVLCFFVLPDGVCEKGSFPAAA